MKKTLTLLHSNDLHGDFLAEKVDEKLTGGVSMLSGYISKVRKEEKNVLYAISGDMFKGSLIDQEYRGISTIEIMNLLAPDVVTLGNHEVDYGLAHLLFLEKCAKFPIINANMFLTSNGTRLFNSHKIIEIDGMKIMFIGILTEDVLEYTRNEKLISTLVGIKDAAEEVGRICMAYQTVDIDLTVLLTHIGWENDQKLAAELDPDWGVDLIIGGHSHTLIDEPAVVAGIPIVHIDNPAGFYTFEDNARFVAKTEEGLRTLREFRNELRGYSRLLTLAEGIHLAPVRWMLRLYFRLCAPLMRRNLCGTRPSLSLFRLYKIGYYLNLH